MSCHVSNTHLDSNNITLIPGRVQLYFVVNMTFKMCRWRGGLKNYLWPIFSAQISHQHIKKRKKQSCPFSDNFRNKPDGLVCLPKSFVPSFSFQVLSLSRKYLEIKIFLSDLDLKTSLTSVDAAVEVGTWLNENNRKCTWYLYPVETGVLCVSGTLEGSVSPCNV